MQNTMDSDHIVGDRVEDQIAVYRADANAGPQFVSSPSGFRMSRQLVDDLGETVDDPIGGSLTVQGN